VSEESRFTLDGREVPAAPGQTIIEAADAAGVYIPRLCHRPGLEPFGSCRICTVKANGRPVSACTYPVSPGLVVESDSDELNGHRRLLLEMLFVEGNHFCMSCEKSGNCELQALGYRFGITAPQLAYQFPVRAVDASHPDILIDHNRCILCARCVRASRDLDRKEVFGFVGRGRHKRIAVSSGARLRDTSADVTDQAMDVCPVGALLRKRVGFAVPVGRRLYDAAPIGTGGAAARGEGR
jgi:[NiFe] hydrogenase diaphorase moiety small subunit